MWHYEALIAGDTGSLEITVFRTRYDPVRPFPRMDSVPAPERGADADRLLMQSGWQRASGWRNWVGWAADVRPAGVRLPEFECPDWVIHLPLTGADGPLVTRVYRDGAYQISFPDGSRCTVTGPHRRLEWADPQVWAQADGGSYQLKSVHHDGHGDPFAAYTEMRFTGPLVFADGTAGGGRPPDPAGQRETGTARSPRILAPSVAARRPAAMRHRPGR